MNIDEKALKSAYLSIKQELGSLEGVSQDVANTAVNVYYEYHNFIANMYKLAANAKNPQQINTDAAFYTSAKKYIAEEIALIRDNQKSMSGETVQILEDAFLDTYKYRLRNVSKKSFARRSIERKLTRSKIIPDLVWLMNKKGYTVY